MLAYATWAIGFTFLHIYILYDVGAVPLSLAIWDGLIGNAFLFLATYLMIFIMRYYQPGRFQRFFWSVGLALACISATRWVMIAITDQDAYLNLLDNTLLIRGIFTWELISIIALITWLISNLREQQELLRRKSDLEQLAKEAELNSLRQQLQPHFLFNSLNSISALAGSQPHEARQMIQQLSDFLRGIVKRDNQQLITLDEELNHLRLYLEIEKVRFGHRLNVELDFSKDLLSAKIPGMVLQPIVENAIKFGLYETTGTITIRLSVKKAGQHIMLRVENPFDPETAPPSGTGFGLSAVKRRLFLLFSRADLLSTQPIDKTYITEVTIPQANDPNNTD